MNTRRVLILDCVSAHEIERGLSTEGDILRSVLANRQDDLGPPILRVATAKSFRQIALRPQKTVTYLHLIGHANESGLRLVKGSVPWKDVAVKLTELVTKLEREEQRVLCLSCCSSERAAKAVAPFVRSYFTGIYYLLREELDFDESITMWSMFYLKKPLETPHHGKSIRDSINSFFDPGRPILQFKRVVTPSRKGQ